MSGIDVVPCAQGTARDRPSSGCSSWQPASAAHPPGPCTQVGSALEGYLMARAPRPLTPHTGRALGQAGATPLTPRNASTPHAAMATLGQRPHRAAHKPRSRSPPPRSTGVCVSRGNAPAACRLVQPDGSRNHLYAPRPRGRRRNLRHCHRWLQPFPGLGELSWRLNCIRRDGRLGRACGSWLLNSQTTRASARRGGPHSGPSPL